ncbi:MAG: MBL fold metallo-hydrolase, partial [Abditibacteriota bacterium]|nr:MBL fold metallo-hydrolase [Abditibacteriota bacterium]
MYCVKKISGDTYYVGASDRKLALFENVYPIPRGISYNSYVVKDEKTVLLDTVDRAVGNQFFENLEHVLDGGSLDYLIVNHMEPDHCATMADLILRYPDVKIVCNAKTVTMIKQFFTFDIDSRAVVIKEGDTLNTGKHTFTFVMAPMVHWPEAMVTYDTTDKVLYSADAFGTFGALSGNIFADEVNFDADWMDDARRYYTNIVGKYGIQVSSLLKKASGIDIDMICPLHGPIWRSNNNHFIDTYTHWATYTPEEKSV